MYRARAVTEALGDTGRILVRESGTEPLLRVMVEAETEEICKKYVDQVVDVVKKKGYVKLSILHVPFFFTKKGRYCSFFIRFIPLK